jgi:hypothetical protein
LLTELSVSNFERERPSNRFEFCRIAKDRQESIEADGNTVYVECGVALACAFQYGLRAPESGASVIAEEDFSGSQFRVLSIRLFCHEVLVSWCRSEQ